MAATGAGDASTSVARLRAALADHLARGGPDTAMRLVGPMAVLTGGRASRLFTLALADAGADDASATRSVLKTYAPDTGGRAHAERESRALTHLRTADFVVPRVLLLEPDPRRLGRPFLVMEHVPGTSFWQAFEAADPPARSRLVERFVAALADLHASQPALLGPSCARPPYAYVDSELAQLRHDVARSTHPALSGVVDWLERRRHLAACARPAVLHRDYHPWNVLVDPAGELWVVDWDWRVGDVRFDLAWTCALMRRSGWDGFADAVRDEYARRTGHALDDLAYFEVLVTARWLVNVLRSLASDDLSGAAEREDFRRFLVEPFRHAEDVLHRRTGVPVRVRP